MCEAKKKRFYKRSPAREDRGVEKRKRVVGAVTDHNPHLISADWKCEDGGGGGRGKSERFLTE